MKTFADVLPVEQLGSHKYSVILEDAWCVGTVPNGGYVTSAFMLVASRHMQLTHTKRKQPHVINLHLEFMRRTAIGQAIFIVKDVKLGSRISNLHLTLTLSDETSNKTIEAVEGYLTVSNMSSEDGLSLETGYSLWPKPLPVSLAGLSENQDKIYVKRGRDPHGDYRRVGRNMAMHVVRPSQRPSHFPKAMVDQWVFFQPYEREGRLTNDALGFVVDIFPQLIEAYVNPGIEDAALKEDLSQREISPSKAKSQPLTAYWYPTLCLNLDVKKLLPKEGVKWLFVRVQAKKIYKGRFDMQVHVLDESGDLVALSNQSNLAFDSSRNTTRKKKEEPSKL